MQKLHFDRIANEVFGGKGMQPCLLKQNMELQPDNPLATYTVEVAGRL